MKRFSFLAHPISVKSVLEKIEPFSNWDRQTIEWFAEKNPMRQFIERTLVEKTEVKEVDTIRGVRSAETGAEVYGNIISCMLLPEQMLSLPKNVVRERITRGIEIAREFGASVICLGGYTSIVMATWREMPEAGEAVITTGNTYTVSVAAEAVLHAARLLDIMVEQASVAIIGATGSIGWASTQLLARQGVKRFILVARNENQLERKTRYLKETFAVTANFTTDPQEAVKHADIIISATSTPFPIIDPGFAKPGCLVCDVSVPHNLDEAKVRQRNDILVLDGGLVQCPGQEIVTERPSPFPLNVAPACLAEAALLTLEGKALQNAPFSPITVEDVLQMRSLGAKHGFRFSHLLSFNEIISPEKIEAVRKARLAATV